MAGTRVPRRAPVGSRPQLERRDLVTAEQLTLRPERIAAGGDAIARQNSGRVVFVSGAIPGELVRATVTEAKRDYGRAVVEEILEPSPNRVVPPCRFVAAGCGGCSWQHIDHGAQRELKRTIVSEALRRNGGIVDAVVDLGEELSPWGFRTTLRMATTSVGRLAYRRHASHELVEIDECLVAHPRLAQVIAEGRFPGATEVVLRCSSTTVEIAASAWPTEANDTAIVPDGVTVGARARITETIEDVSLQISARSFFQTRSDGAAALVRTVRELSAPAPAGLVIDAFGGVGLFAATVRPESEVVVIDTSSSSCNDARRNLRKRRSSILQIDVASWKARRAALVIADPARAGLGAGAATALASAAAPVVVLVSCDPASLARDAKLLASHGYRHARSVVVDLFPHTSHVEVVTQFIRTVPDQA